MVRRATTDDADVLAGLCGLVQQLHVTRRPDVFVPVDHATLAEWFRARLVDDSAMAWLAHSKGTPAGYTYAVINERPANPFTNAMCWLEIVQLGVHPDHQRMGIARALIQAVLAEARVAGIDDIRIRTWAFNEDAQAAFQRLGFRPRTLEYGLFR